MPERFRVATFNVNSINVRADATLAWLEKHQPNVLGLQELKCTDQAFPSEPFEKWNAHTFGQPSYNGVALLGTSSPDEVVRSFNDGVDDDQARFIAGRYGDIWVLNTYVPQGSQVGSPKFEYKLQWLERFLAFLNAHHSPKDKVIWIGDYNIAPEDEDIYAPDFFEDDVGAHPDERALLERIRDWGFTDIFRKFHPTRRKAFTFFDYRTRDSVKYNKGWRIDHIWTTASLAEAAKACDIDMEPRHEERASDHTPLWADFEV